MTLSRPQTIFIVDDQQAIRTTAKAVLDDESYRAITFESAEALDEGLKVERPDLILLDIWLPGIDGLEALGKIKAQYPHIPVILMSGHAGVDVAVGAMRAGAADFLEKPLNLDFLLEKVAKHLAPAGKTASDQVPRAAWHSGHERKGEIASLEVSPIPQRTVRKNAVMNGVGLLSGRPTGIIVRPLPVNSGIVFQTLDGVEIPGQITSLENLDQMSTKGAFTANSTVLTNTHRRVRTVEHLLAALNMMGITNASIKVDEEIPNIDGSSVDFCKILADAGIQNQNEPRMEIVIHQKIGIGNETKDEKHLYVEPFDGFEVDMRVNYPAPIGEQTFCFNPAQHSFEREIAPARSFNTFENIDMAQKQGMVGSGYLNSHIIIHDGKVINTKLNYPDEFVRHKILDLLGDLYLLGYGIKGRVKANMTSHGLNQALVLKIHQSLNAVS